MIQRACAWTSLEVSRAVGGELIGSPERALAGVSTDTRDALANQLFVALAGEKYDAHDFLDQALAKGAGALLVSKPLANANVPQIVVKDTLRALGDLGAEWRRRHPIPVVALTGSNGKTTTKEMLAAILGVSRKVLKTEGNLNNLIGVPMTLLGLTGEHEVAVIEMGMNTRGEIARYTELARPDVGMVINVGPAHVGMLGSLEAIAEAKGELYAGLDRERAIAVINVDDPQVVRVAHKAAVTRTRTFGRNVGADVRLVDFELRFDPASEARSEAEPSGDGRAALPRGHRFGVRAQYLVDGRALEVELPIAGAHNAINAAGAIAAATALVEQLSLDEIRTGISASVREKRRMAFEPIGEWLVVDDCYNANSASMLAAIDTVSSYVAKKGGRFVALLGEMRELGEYSDAEHVKVGEALANKKPALVCAFGALAKPIAEVAKQAGLEAHHERDDFEAAAAWLLPRLEAGDAVLVKGSRGMKMERFIERMRASSKREV